MPFALNLIGQRFTRLVVIKYLPSRKEKRICLCQCDCGKTAEVVSGRLRSGETKSCGCLYIEHARRLGLSHMRHGHARTGKKSGEYSCWNAMITRCTNKKAKDFHLYGGRGISVCERWASSFENFLADMGPRPSLKYSIDRFPNKDGHYEPGNCRWATAKQQSRNSRKNRLITCNGITKILKEWSEESGISGTTIRDRLKRGLTPEQALGKS